MSFSNKAVAIFDLTEWNSLIQSNCKNKSKRHELKP